MSTKRIGEVADRTCIRDIQETSVVEKAEKEEKGMAHMGEAREREGQGRNIH